MSAAAAGALADVISAFAEPSGWCAGAVLPPFPASPFPGPQTYTHGEQRSFSPAIKLVRYFERTPTSHPPSVGLQSRLAATRRRLAYKVGWLPPAVGWLTKSVGCHPPSVGSEVGAHPPSLAKPTIDQRFVDRNPSSRFCLKTKRYEYWSFPKVPHTSYVCSARKPERDEGSQPRPALHSVRCDPKMTSWALGPQR